MNSWRGFGGWRAGNGFAGVLALVLFGAAQGVVNAQDTARWSWQEPQAKVLPTGDLEWAPKPFVFKAGESVRYIDFD